MSAVLNGSLSEGGIQDADKGSAKEEQSPVLEEAWRLLRKAVVDFQGVPVGTLAAVDPADASGEASNYDQVFVRDFVSSAMAFIFAGEFGIVRNFLLQTLSLQSYEKIMDCYSPGEGLMPASFKVKVEKGLDGTGTQEVLEADFGEAAIGRVVPVDSCLWWVILLRAYEKASGDTEFARAPGMQEGLKKILALCTMPSFDMFPTLLVSDGACMIDRRMGIHGHPLEIQALYYHALHGARQMLVEVKENDDLKKLITNRLSALVFHIRSYYWLDHKKLNEMYRYKTEEYDTEALNKFNIYPESLPRWLLDWLPDKGGYFLGNVSPAHMDFRWFALGNCWAVVSSLATKEQAKAIVDLVEEKWDDLVAHMPLKICYPALEDHGWRIVTGCDPKNTEWSYHNGGAWPVLLWHFTAACAKVGRLDLARKAIEIAEKKLSRDDWPEYYDGKDARLVGKQARKFQCWSIAGLIVARQILENPERLCAIQCDEDSSLVFACHVKINSSRKRKANGDPETDPILKARLEAGKAAAKKLVADNPIMIFSASYCPYCSSVKQLLTSIGAKFHSFDMDKHPDGADLAEAVQDMTALKTVPNVFIGGKHVGGSDDVAGLHEKGKLVKMLREAGALGK